MLFMGLQILTVNVEKKGTFKPCTRKKSTIQKYSSMLKKKLVPFNSLGNKQGPLTGAGRGTKWGFFLEDLVPDVTSPRLDRQACMKEKSL